MTPGPRPRSDRRRRAVDDDRDRTGHGSRQLRALLTMSREPMRTDEPSTALVRAGRALAKPAHADSALLRVRDEVNETSGFDRTGRPRQVPCRHNQRGFHVQAKHMFRRVRRKHAVAAGIRNAAVMLRESLRESDVLARFGGKEFVAFVRADAQSWRHARRTGCPIRSLWAPILPQGVGHTPERMSPLPPQDVRTAQRQSARRPSRYSSRMSLSAYSAATHFSRTAPHALR